MINVKLSKFYSTNYVKHFLQTCYEKNYISDFYGKGIQNVTPFISYIENGEIFIKQACKSPIQIQPILIFYGLLHFMKAGILTCDENYPRTTAVLAHGVSTKKRKKNGYEFMEDEVKIQKDGLFLHAATVMYGTSISPQTKIKMKELLGTFEELKPLFQNYKIKQEPQKLPCLLALYLVFYNLSMIARYETEWWTNLLKIFSHYDYAFIKELIELAPLKITSEISDFFNMALLPRQ